MTVPFLLVLRPKTSWLHCTMCRRSPGAALSTYADLDPSEFRWISGEQLVTVYDCSPGIGASAEYVAELWRQRDDRENNLGDAGHDRR